MLSSSTVEQHSTVSYWNTVLGTFQGSSFRDDHLSSDRPSWSHYRARLSSTRMPVEVMIDRRAASRPSLRLRELLLPTAYGTRPVVSHSLEHSCRISSDLEPGEPCEYCTVLVLRRRHDTLAHDFDEISSCRTAGRSRAADGSELTHRVMRATPLTHDFNASPGRWCMPSRKGFP